MSIPHTVDVTVHKQCRKISDVISQTRLAFMHHPYIKKYQGVARTNYIKPQYVVFTEDLNNHI